MNVSFNNDGPVKVSQTDFDAYRTLFGKNRPDFDALVVNWLDERNPDGLRRLCLRDILRQSSLRPSAHAYHQTDMSLGRFNNLWVENKSSFTPHLEHRPKLLQELIDEFTFTLENNRLGDCTYSQRNIDQLIKYLIQRIDEKTSRQLLLHHSRWKPGAYQPENTTSLLGDIIDPKLPAWLRSDLWDTLKAQLQKEANLCHKALRPSPFKKNSTNTDADPIRSIGTLIYRSGLEIIALSATQQFIGIYSVKCNEADFTPLIPIIKFLEEILPKNLAYTPGHEMIRIAPYLPDDEAAFIYARHHLLSHEEETFSFMADEWRRFLYWLRGLTTSIHPDDTELLAEIDHAIPKTLPTHE